MLWRYWNAWVLPKKSLFGSLLICTDRMDGQSGQFYRSSVLGDQLPVPEVVSRVLATGSVACKQVCWVEDWLLAAVSDCDMFWVRLWLHCCKHVPSPICKVPLEPLWSVCEVVSLVLMNFACLCGDVTRYCVVRWFVAEKNQKKGATSNVAIDSGMGICCSCSVRIGWRFHGDMAAGTGGAQLAVLRHYSIYNHPLALTIMSWMPWRPVFQW